MERRFSYEGWLHLLKRILNDILMLIKNGTLPIEAFEKNINTEIFEQNNTILFRPAVILIIIIFFFLLQCRWLKQKLGVSIKNGLDLLIFLWAQIKKFVFTTVWILFLHFLLRKMIVFNIVFSLTDFFCKVYPCA